MCSMCCCRCLDDGRLTDNKGRMVNFKNTIIIMTSNMGSHIIQDAFENVDEDNQEEVVEQAKDRSDGLAEANHSSRVFKPDR